MPTPNKALSRLEHLFVTKETTFGTAVAPVATDGLRHIKFTGNNDIKLLRRRDKTGSRTGVLGAQGRGMANWSYEGSLYGSGTPGGLPDSDILLQMIFGQPAVSSVYTLADTIVSGNLWSYRQPTTVDQRGVIGAIARTFTFTLGEDIAEWSCDGTALGVVSSNEFAFATGIALDAPLVGGLGSFPAEPTPFTVHDGGAIAGFTGVITIDAGTVVFLRTATIKGNVQGELITDTFGTYWASGTQGGEREITFGFNCYDDDSAALSTIREAALDKAPIEADVTIGTVAGNKFTFTVKGIQLAADQLDDATLSYTANFADSPAKGTDPSLRNELSLTIG